MACCIGINSQTKYSSSEERDGGETLKDTRLTASRDCLAEQTQNTQRQGEPDELDRLAGPGIQQGRWVDNRAARKHTSGWFDKQQ